MNSQPVLEARVGLALNPAKARMWIGSAARFARKKPLGFFGAVILILVAIIAIGAPIIATHDPLVIDVAHRLEGPSRAHYFGTDQLGRDAFSRICYGARVSLLVGFGAAAITILLATVIGTLSGYFKGTVDAVVQRVVDAFMALPILVMLMAAVFIFGKGLLNVIIVLGVIAVPAASRVVRGATLGVMANQYVGAAKSMGASNSRIILRYVLPNIAAPILVIVSIYVGSNILAEAALSFLGLGVAPPAATWGNMLSLDGLGALSQNMWLAFFPGAFITLTVFGINGLGDALRDQLDPTRRGL